MAPNIRPATPDDIPQLIELLIQDAKDREAADPILWKIAAGAPAQIGKALTFALTASEQPFRQIWQIAEEDGSVTGVSHAMLLPVPPIYAGPLGDPGLVLPDTFAAPGAPRGTIDALLSAAEHALRDAGAQIILTSWVTGADWQRVLDARGYEPLTLYLSHTGLDDQPTLSGVTPATADDIPGIVLRSAEHRKIIFDIDPFWETHPDADTRFAAWMTRSLTLSDRDMMTHGTSGDMQGYVIAQPATRLHFPPAHDISETGVIDDFYHTDMANPVAVSGTGAGAAALIHAAETAFARRGMNAAFVVCPAGWPSKIKLLQTAGYTTAMVWYIKR